MEEFLGECLRVLRSGQAGQVSLESKHIHITTLSRKSEALARASAGDDDDVNGGGVLI